MQPGPRKRPPHEFDGERDRECEERDVGQPRIKGQIRPIEGQRRQEDEEQGAEDEHNQ